MTQPTTIYFGADAPERVLDSNFGCYIGTFQKSATYENAGAVERRAVPIGELVENNGSS
jgi:hypothetical protein